MGNVFICVYKKIKGDDDYEDDSESACKLSCVKIGSCCKRKEETRTPVKEHQKKNVKYSSVKRGNEKKFVSDLRKDFR